VSDPDLVGQAVAGALSLQLPDPGVESLVAYLSGRRVMLVLDNCEHLVDACAELVDGLLMRCGELHILATSREPLGVDGEQVFRVPSLSLETDAVRLFMDRARAAGARLEVDPASDSVVAEICRRLDGIPLAIELAAARSTHLAPIQVLERLSDRFRLLTGGRRRVQRQQTLAAAIDWSHGLLSDPEQALFRRLAVFRGSFSLQAVEEICRPDAVDLLGSLVDKSLVNVQVQAAAPRYRLLETVRMYAEERLVASGEAAKLRSAQRDWLLRWLESLPIGQLLELGGGERLVPEVDNLAAALEWSLEEDRLDLVARIASRLLGYWWSYQRVAELGTWWRVLEEGLARLSGDLRAAALLVGVQHAMATGDFDEMEQLSAAALASAAQGSWSAAYAWSMRALWLTYGDPEQGRRCIDEGRKAAVAARVPEIERMTTIWSANLLTGDPDRDAEVGRGEILDNVLATVGDAGPGLAYVALGIVAALGDTATASRLVAGRTAGSVIQRYMQELMAAVIAIDDGRTEAASEHLRILVTLVREYAVPLGEALCLTGFAALAASTGEYETASRQLAAVRMSARFPFRSPVDALVYRKTIRAVRDALDPETAARCRAEGEAVPVSRALDEQLARLDAAVEAR
jgi:predicted ATPase